MKYFMVLVLLLFQTACGSSGGGGGAPSNETTADVNQNGGKIVLGKAVLDIPAGALSQKTTITVKKTVVSGSNVAELEGITVYDFQPDGLVFNQPVALTLPMNGGNADSVVAEYHHLKDFDDPNIFRDFLEVFDTSYDADSDTGTAMITGFSAYTSWLGPPTPARQVVLKNGDWDACSRQLTVRWTAATDELSTTVQIERLHRQGRSSARG